MLRYLSLEGKLERIAGLEPVINGLEARGLTIRRYPQSEPRVGIAPTITCLRIRSPATWAFVAFGASRGTRTLVVRFTRAVPHFSAILAFWWKGPESNWQ